MTPTFRHRSCSSNEVRRDSCGVVFWMPFRFRRGFDLSIQLGVTWSRFFNSSSSPLMTTIRSPLGGWTPTQPHDIAKRGRDFELPFWMLSGFFVAFHRQPSPPSLPRPAERPWPRNSSPFYRGSRLQTRRRAPVNGLSLFPPSSEIRIRTMNPNDALVRLISTKGTWSITVHADESGFSMLRKADSSIFVPVVGIVLMDLEPCRNVNATRNSMGIINGIS